MEELPAGQTVCPACGWDNTRPQEDGSLLREGTILQGKYLIGRKLGKGGFGVTYLARDLILKIKVAVKEYFPFGISSRSSTSQKIVVNTQAEEMERFQKGRDAFQKEAQALALFNSTSIIHVREFFIDNNTAYIVMDYVDGPGLSSEIRRLGRIPWQRVLSLMIPLMPELGQLHRRNMIHRDIKPENIKIARDEYTNQERLVLLDFGAARNYASGELVGSYTQILTPGYAPFEQYKKKSRQGPYTDVYALCATMYHAITGELPPASMALAFGDAKLKPLSEFGLGIPEAVEKAIMHGLELRPENRPQTIDDLHKELLDAAPDLSSAPAPVPSSSDTAPMIPPPASVFVSQSVPASVFSPAPKSVQSSDPVNIPKPVRIPLNETPKKEEDDGEIYYCSGCMEKLRSGQKRCPRCGCDNSFSHNKPPALTEDSILNGKYIVGRMISKSSSEINYLGLNLDLNARVSIKEFFMASCCTRPQGSRKVRGVSGDPVVRQNYIRGLMSFEKSAKLINPIKSSALPRIRDLFRENDTSYIVMEFYEGHSLSEEIKQTRRIPWQRVVSLMLPLINEFNLIHEKNVIHRNIKPENLRIAAEENSNQEHLVITDFGSALNLRNPGDFLMIVTQGYSPLEQYDQNGFLGPHSDIYSLCATMYKAITGQTPPPSVHIYNGRDVIRPFSEFGVEIPKEVERAIMHGLELHYENRPRTMAELHDELESAAGEIREAAEESRQKLKVIQDNDLNDKLFNRKTMVGTDDPKLFIRRLFGKK